VLLFVASFVHSDFWNFHARRRQGSKNSIELPALFYIFKKEVESREARAFISSITYNRVINVSDYYVRANINRTWPRANAKKERKRTRSGSFVDHG
jgi:hypothetical protein